MPTDVTWELIVAIDPLPAEPVYDIEVAGTHNFVANGLLAHNTSFDASPIASASAPTAEAAHAPLGQRLQETLQGRTGLLVQDLATEFGVSAEDIQAAAREAGYEVVDGQVVRRVGGGSEATEDQDGQHKLQEGREELSGGRGARGDEPFGQDNPARATPPAESQPPNIQTISHSSGELLLSQAQSQRSPQDSRIQHRPDREQLPAERRRPEERPQDQATQNDRVGVGQKPHERSPLAVGESHLNLPYHSPLLASSAPNPGPLAPTAEAARAALGQRLQDVIQGRTDMPIEDLARQLDPTGRLSPVDVEAAAREAGFDIVDGQVVRRVGGGGDNQESSLPTAGVLSLLQRFYAGRTHLRGVDLHTGAGEFLPEAVELFEQAGLRLDMMGTETDSGWYEQARHHGDVRQIGILELLRQEGEASYDFISLNAPRFADLVPEQANAIAALLKPDGVLWVRFFESEDEEAGPITKRDGMLSRLRDAGFAVTAVISDLEGLPRAGMPKGRLYLFQQMQAGTQLARESAMQPPIAGGSGAAEIPGITDCSFCGWDPARVQGTIPETLAYLRDVSQIAEANRQSADETASQLQQALALQEVPEGVSPAQRLEAWDQLDTALAHAQTAALRERSLYLRDVVIRLRALLASLAGAPTLGRAGVPLMDQTRALLMDWRLRSPRLGEVARFVTLENRELREVTAMRGSVITGMPATSEGPTRGIDFELDSAGLTVTRLTGSRTDRAVSNEEFIRVLVAWLKDRGFKRIETVRLTEDGERLFRIVAAHGSADAAQAMQVQTRERNGRPHDPLIVLNLDALDARKLRKPLDPTARQQQEIEERLQRRTARGSGWVRLTATMPEAANFHQAFSSEAIGWYGTVIDGRSMHIPASVWDKMVEWFAKSPDFERRGQWLLDRQEDGAWLAVDFIPLASFAADPDLHPVPQPADVTQLIGPVNAFDPIVTLAQARALGAYDPTAVIPVDERYRLEQDGRFAVVPAHSHHRESQYRDQPSGNDQERQSYRPASRAQDAPRGPPGWQAGFVYSMATGHGRFYTNQEQSELLSFQVESQRRTVADTLAILDQRFGQGPLFRGQRKYLAQALEVLHGQAPKKVLVAGSGIAYLPQALAVMGIPVMLVEKSPESVERARTVLHGLQSDSRAPLEVVEANLDALHMQPAWASQRGTFDAVMLLSLVGPYFEGDLQHALQNSYDAARPGALIFLPNHPLDKATPQTMADVLMQFCPGCESAGVPPISTSYDTLDRNYHWFFSSLDAKGTLPANHAYRIVKPIAPIAGGSHDDPEPPGGGEGRGGFATISTQYVQTVPNARLFPTYVVSDALFVLLGAMDGGVGGLAIPPFSSPNHWSKTPGGRQALVLIRLAGGFAGIRELEQRVQEGGIILLGASQVAQLHRKSRMKRRDPDDLVTLSNLLWHERIHLLIDDLLRTNPKQWERIVRVLETTSDTKVRGVWSSVMAVMLPPASDVAAEADAPAPTPNDIADEMLSYVLTFPDEVLPEWLGRVFPNESVRVLTRIRDATRPSTAELEPVAQVAQRILASRPRRGKGPQLAQIDRLTRGERAWFEEQGFDVDTFRPRGLSINNGLPEADGGGGAPRDVPSGLPPPPSADSVAGPVGAAGATALEELERFFTLRVELASQGAPRPSDQLDAFIDQLPGSEEITDDNPLGIIPEELIGAYLVPAFDQGTIPGSVMETLVQWWERASKSHKRRFAGAVSSPKANTMGVFEELLRALQAYGRGGAGPANRAVDPQESDGVSRREFLKAGIGVVGAGLAVSTAHSPSQAQPSGVVAGVEGLESLGRLLEHPEPRVRRETVQKLAHVADPRAINLIVRALQADTDTTVRAIAADELMTRAGRRAIDRWVTTHQGAIDAVIQAAEHDPDLLLRRHVKLALRFTKFDPLQLRARLKALRRLPPKVEVLPKARGARSKVALVILDDFGPLRHGELVRAEAEYILLGGWKYQLNRLVTMPTAIPIHPIHHNAIGMDLRSFENALSQLERLVDAHPDTTFVVNMSLGVLDNFDRVNGLLPIDLVKRLGRQGVVFVLPAGKYDDVLLFDHEELDNVLHVAAANAATGRKTAISGYGWSIYMTAPGAGTSLAAPRVAARLAKILDDNKTRSGPEAIDQLRQAVEPMPNEPLWKRGLLGSGLLRLMGLGFVMGAVMGGWTGITGLVILGVGVDLLWLYGRSMRRGMLSITNSGPESGQSGDTRPGQSGDTGNPGTQDLIPN